MELFSGWRRLSTQYRSCESGSMQGCSELATKVPAITLGFWITKIAATTLGETGGDTVTMTLNFGYLVGAEVLFVVLLALIALQICVKDFRPVFYWATIVASTMFGTAMADFVDRSLGMGFFSGTLLLLMSLIAMLCLWYALLGSISVGTVSRPGPESFYWTAVTFSQTLGTALGDWLADSKGLGYEESALVFAGSLTIIAACYFWTNISRVALFWGAFILTRPLGATVGDFLDKPISDGGLAASRALVSALLAVFIVTWILLLPQRAAKYTSAAAY
jgi:uncharacterized membrane-anchored protein